MWINFWCGIHNLNKKNLNKKFKPNWISQSITQNAILSKFDLVFLKQYIENHVWNYLRFYMLICFLLPKNIIQISKQFSCSFLHDWIRFQPWWLHFSPTASFFGFASQSCTHKHINPLLYTLVYRLAPSMVRFFDQKCSYKKVCCFP